ncbi:histone deacetylase family protein [Dictyocaulus viviparus]|uniref:Histone deacetylase family protein n=1 Tax=Dictyocaulus viviparus TaxID=29172 RepID=A0A0D8X8F7_DICVI|nr:histone deacetylase family protein [Dictyocaulus viviparus]
MMYAIDKYNVQRVLILDWDIHHGNGTQEIFYEDERVLYISLHRHDDGEFYPTGAPKDYSDIGEGKGKGFSLNIPWNSGDIGDDAYRAAFAKIIMPTAYEYNPELVFISAGFDAAAGDPLGGCKVSCDTFSLMTYQLMALAGGRTIAVLEGEDKMKKV